MKGLGSKQLICSDPIHLFLFESGTGEAEAMTSIAVPSLYIYKIVGIFGFPLITTARAFDLES